ncbi:hypothetical protein ACCC97_26080 [Variovorax sp. Varisp85]
MCNGAVLLAIFAIGFSILTFLDWAPVAIDSLTRYVAAMFGRCNARPLLSETSFMKILLIEDVAELAASISEAAVQKRFLPNCVPNLLQAPGSRAYR